MNKIPLFFSNLFSRYFELLPDYPLLCILLPFVMLFLTFYSLVKFVVQIIWEFPPKGEV